MGSQLNHVLFCGLAKSKVSDFDSSLVEENVLGLQVVMDDLVWQLVQIADGTHHLPDY